MFNRIETSQLICSDLLLPLPHRVLLEVTCVGTRKLNHEVTKFIAYVVLQA